VGIMEEIIYKPIGIIHSPYTDVNDMPKSSDDRATTAELVVNKEYLESMADMKVGEEYMIIFHFINQMALNKAFP
jgi:tRNA (Thr-GGU) A37 N-methylase